LTQPVHTGERPSFLDPEAELIRGDVADPGAFRRALDGVEAVIHLAAYQDYLTDFSRFFHTNTVGIALLYELIVNERLPVHKVVVGSTQAVYGEGRYRCPEHGVIHPGQRSSSQLEAGDWELYCPTCKALTEPLWSEESKAHPENSYAISKHAQEQLALALGRRYGLSSVALRYSIVHGARQSFRNAYSGALRSFAVRVLTGQPPVVYEDGLQQRDYVSVHDVVRANLLALEDPRADDQVFNVGSGRRVTVLELARAVLDEAGSSLEPAFPGLYRVGDTRHVFSEVSRLTALGWSPMLTQREMVHEYLAWASEQPGLWDTVAPAQARMKELGVLRPLVQRSG
jgi:dTDP-L-rhamnose 4-epimerase